jgi:multidrug efflux system membrane fusion protein
MRAQVATLEATIAADQALVDTAKLNFDFTRITSPVAGRVGLRQVDPGSIVHASDTIGLVTVTQMQPISVLFSLPQDGLRAILAGQSNGQLAVAVDTRDGTQHIADGTLVFVDSQVDQSTGQIRLKAFFTDGDNALWPGEFVTARLLVRTEHNATVVPARAVQNSQAGPYIFTIGPDNTAVFRPVKVGATVEGYTAILSGVAPGQTVVLDGQSRLSPNAKVSPAQAPLSDNLGAPQ